MRKKIQRIESNVSEPSFHCEYYPYLCGNLFNRLEGKYRVDGKGFPYRSKD